MIISNNILRPKQKIHFDSPSIGEAVLYRKYSNFYTSLLFFKEPIRFKEETKGSIEKVKKRIRNIPVISGFEYEQI